MRTSKTRAVDLRAKERRSYVFNLRQSGASYELIHRTISANPAWVGKLPKHYTRREVHADVMLELKEIKVSADDIEAVRSQELERLDRMLMAIWPMALGKPATPGALGRPPVPAVPASIEAQQQIIRIMERRAKYLPGVNAPIPVAPVSPDGEKSYHEGANADFFAALMALAQEFGPLHMAENTSEELPLDLAGIGPGDTTNGSHYANGTNGTTGTNGAHHP